jgi:hypothetical protein
MQAEVGQILLQKDSAKRAGTSEFQVARWNRDNRWREAVTKILYAHNDPLVPLLQRALLIRGISGSIRHAELALRTRGLIDVEPGTGPGGVPQAAAIASVTFVGLPEPLSASQAAALRPPQGSTIVYRPVLPPAAPGGK